MKKFFAIVKTEFLSAISISKSKKLRFVSVSGSCITIAVVVYFLTKLALRLYNIKFPFPVFTGGIEAIILNSVVLIAFLFIILSTFSMILASLYLSSNNNLLLSMPIKEEIVFSARFVFMVLELDLFILPLVYPFFIAYGLKFGLGIIYYILSFFFVAFIPVVPFAIASFILIPLAERFPARKINNIVFVLNILFGIFGYIITQFLNPWYGLSKTKSSVFINLIGKILKYLPSNIGYVFANSFTKGKAFSGFTSMFIFVLVSLGFFYASVLFAKNHYNSGIMNSAKSEGRKIKYREESKVFSILPLKVRALVIKDIKIVLRDTKIKTMVLMNFAYIVFFLFVFIYIPLNGPHSSHPDIFGNLFMAFMLYVLVDFMICSQNGSILFTLDRESIWVLLMSKVSAVEFFWSKFVSPFVSGEVIGFLLFAANLTLLKLINKGNVEIVFLSLPVLIFFPLLLTSITLLVSALFPNFKTPKNPNKLVSGKVAIINIVIEAIAVFLATGFSFIAEILYKSKGFSFTLIIMFAIIGAVSIALSFPSIAFAINRIKNFQLG